MWRVPKHLLRVSYKERAQIFLTGRSGTLLPASILSVIRDVVFRDVMLEDVVFDNNSLILCLDLPNMGSQNYYYQTPHPQTPHPSTPESCKVPASAAASKPGDAPLATEHAIETTTGVKE